MNNKKTFQDIWRDYYEKSFNVSIPILAILSAFVVSGFILIAWGANVFEAYGALFSGAFGSPNAIATTLIRSTPLLFTGLAVAYGYRGGFFNIGAEGQLWMGAYAAVWVGATLTNWPGWALIPACMAAAMLFGSLYALLPGILKATRGVNEVLTTLLMNYIAIQFAEWAMRVDHFTRGLELNANGEVPVWSWVSWIGIKDPAQPFPKSPFTAEAAYMPSLKSIMEIPIFVNLFGSSAWYESISSIPAFGRMTLAPVLGVGFVLLMYFIMFRTTIGYKSRAVGINPQAAKAMGINIPRTIIITALISGALAGLAGGMEVLGSQHRIIPKFLVNAGFEGIPVALIGQLHPIGVLLSATFFGALKAGANKMGIITMIPVTVIYVIQALAILFAIAGTTFDVESTLKKRRLMRRQPPEPPSANLSNTEEESHV
ncbi:MAG: ABC transporter permease [Chloroflexi bacterium]|jgi:general nucleoside transport system permease protein|nr:ABC transporter permease [Chloroflexota bacterium]